MRRIKIINKILKIRESLIYFTWLENLKFIIRIGCQLWGSAAIGEATHIQMESIKAKRKVKLNPKY